MTESEDRSYYEISLTSGQVLVAFGVLLACVLGAFVAGMWVAREALEDAGPAATAQRPLDSAEPTETLDFFDGDSSSSRGAAGDAAGAGEADGPPAARSATGPRDAAGESRSQQEASRIQQVKPLPPDRTASTSPPPDTGARETPENRDTSANGASSASPEPAEPDAPEVSSVDTDRREPVAEAGDRASRAEPAAPPDPSADASAGFVIQVFSSIEEAQAEALLQRLRSRGYPVFRASEPVSGRTMYRVRVGPYADRPTAEREAQKLEREFKLDTWVTASG